MTNANNDKISFIATIYNRPDYARNVIFMLQKQTHKIDELIFADDGSKENIGDCIKDLLPSCDFAVKHVTQADLGFRAARSRNNGVRASEGNFLIFIDSDLIAPPDFVETIYKNRKKKRIVFSLGIPSSEEQKIAIQNVISQGFDYDKIYQIISDEQKNKMRMFWLKCKLYEFLYRLKLRSRGSKLISMAFALYKKDFISLNGFDDKYKGWGKEDDDLGNRFFKYGGRAKMVLPLRFPIHMYHKPVVRGKGVKEPNEAYYRARKKEISKTNFRCENGYANSVDTDKITFSVLWPRQIQHEKPSFNLN